MNGKQQITPTDLKLIPGDIIIYNATKGGFFSSAQRYFTRMNFTHTAVVFNQVIGMDSVIEAKEAVAITPFSETLQDSTVEFWIFSIDGVDNLILQDALKYAYIEFSGKTYGFLQLLYFIRRWIWETKWVKILFGWLPRLLGKPADVRQWNNWFVSGTICSELKWHYDEHIATKIGDDDWLKILHEWNSNNFHSGDAYNVCERVQRIHLKYERKFVDGTLTLYRY